MHDLVTSQFHVCLAAIGVMNGDRALNLARVKNGDGQAVTYADQVADIDKRVYAWDYRPFWSDGATAPRLRCDIWSAKRQRR